MVDAVPLLLAGSSIAAAHALIPSHWLSFVLVARAQGWPLRRTLYAVALAGGGHVAATSLLGVIVAKAGASIPDEFERLAIPAVLILLGLWFLYPAVLGRGSHRHVHLHLGRGHHEHTCSDHAYSASSPDQPARSGAASMGALVAGMTLSPCLDMMPIYLAAASQSQAIVAALSLLIGAVTILLMCLLVLAASLGLQRANLSRWSRAEPAAVGIVLIGLAVYSYIGH